MEKKVLFTASTFQHVVRFHLPCLHRFRDEGWTVHAACGGPAMDIPYADQTIPLHFKQSMRPLKNLQAAVILRRKIHEEHYRLISTHTTLAAFFTRLAVLGLRNRPAIADTVHGYLFDGKTSRLRRCILLSAERLTAPVTDLLFTMNRWDHETALRYQLGRTVVRIPGAGVDLSRFDGLPPDTRQRMRKRLGIPKDAVVLIYAAEFSKNKSQSVLIQALEKLPEQVILVLAGDGALRGGCERLAQERGLAHRVLFPGYQEDIGAWYQMADIAVASSRKEGLPFNIIESMYTGLPVVASDVKGHQDLITDGETGLLYPYGDASACAGQIQKLLSSAPLWELLTRQAKQAASQYALERVFPQIWAEYEKLLCANDLPKDT